jgi:hypothetical protein
MRWSSSASWSLSPSVGVPLPRDACFGDNAASPRKDRKKIEMLFAHLKRILKLDRLRLRGLSGAQNEFLLAATAQNLRRMAKWLTPPAPEPPGIAVYSSRRARKPRSSRSQKQKEQE